MLADAPKNFGLLAIEIYFPKKCVNQTDLEVFDNVSTGKYTIGLGQEKMALVDDREDINSMALTAVQSLVEKYNISYSNIGRLEVGTETIIDKSKSVKSVLMQLFVDSGNTNVEGVDTTNACYGGTNALFNSINWMESSSWDGRFALVVAGDIAVYKEGAARPTGGAGVVAMLLGPNAPVVFDSGVRSTHMEHVWDFYKPDLHSEYPEVDGALSNMCYLKSVDICYNRFLDNLQKKSENPLISIDEIDYFVFHCPYSKLVQKSFARLSFNDFLRNPDLPKYAQLQEFRNLKAEETYTNRDVEKAFMAHTKALFAEKMTASLIVSKNVGNMYCGSVYGGLASILSHVDSDTLLNKRIVLFSYGSGLAASMFSVKVVGSTSEMFEKLNISKRLANRQEVDPSVFDSVMMLREKTHNMKSYTPTAAIDSQNLFPGTFYLEEVDSKFRRRYNRTEI